VPKKSIRPTLNRSKYFFFASTAESRAKFLKLVLDRVSKFGWMKNCVLKFKVVLSFFKSLNLSRLNFKYLENSESILCCVRRKVIRKGVGNVTKNGKALLKYTKYVSVQMPSVEI